MERKQLTELVAIGLVGDGILALVAPSRHSRLWSGGPKRWQRAMQAFAERPMLVRLLAACEVVGGLWLALRQYPD